VSSMIFEKVRGDKPYRSKLASESTMTM
jgi:hypothetical protein